MGMFGLRCARKCHDDAAEREKLALLEKAEKDLVDLKDRAHKATTYLTERRNRNHFAESIRMTVRGT
jgi:hypothetical protein